MFRKIIAIIIIFILTTSSVLAFRLYIKPALSYLSTSQDGDPSEVIAPSIAGGLGQLVNKYLYLGLEAYWIPNTIPVNNQSNSTYKISYQYGLAAIPGIAFDSSILGYLRLGMLRSKFSTLNAVESAPQLGIGLEYNLSPAWSVNGEYDYVRYRGDVVGSTSTDQFTLGLMYKFNI